MPSALFVSRDGRRVAHADGKPFFWLGDTAWELFHKLNREDTLLYLDARARQGFTVIQAVALAEFDGLDAPNAYGRRPLRKNARGEYDPCLPDVGAGYGYWSHVDFVVDEAAARGMYVGLLPTWGDKYNKAWGIGPCVFTPENAYAYGHFVGSRYREKENIVWILGGDRPLTERAHFEVILGMARGLREGDGGAHLIAFHPCGGQSSSAPLHNEPIVDLNMIQSGHTRSRYNYAMIAADYALTPPKPVLDAEPGYEGHPEGFKPENGYLDAVDARQEAYWALLSGACGHTYGHHSIWSFYQNDMPGFQPNHFCVTWRQALESPGANQMRFAKRLLLSRDMLAAKPAQDMLCAQFEGALHIPVLAGRDFLIAYTSQGAPIRLKLGMLSGDALRAWWYRPATGEATAIGAFANEGERAFQPPTGGRGEDWALVLDDAAAGYGTPGEERP